MLCIWWAMGRRLMPGPGLIVGDRYCNRRKRLLSRICNVNLDEIRKYQFPMIEDEYTFKDSILYGLGLGYGTDPLNRDELHFVTEDDQRVVPTQCNIMSYPGFWVRDLPQLGLDWVRVVHGEQMIRILQPLPAAAKVQARTRISAIDDKGSGKGAAVYVERDISVVETGEVLAQVHSTVFARGDGGQGSFGVAPPPPARIAASTPDAVCEIPTSTRAALIYRLSGDFNPIHSNPDAAGEAGFDRPILHGMCTMGIACRAILQTFCDNRPERLKYMFVRFSQPVFPGETIRVEFFREPDALRFRALAVERNVIVLDRCSAELSP